MALYIDADITGTGGAGTSGNPYKSWADFRIANATRDLVTEAVGALDVYIKGLLSDPNSGIGYTLSTTANASNYYRFLPWPGYESATFASMPGFYVTTTGSGSTLFNVGAYHRAYRLRMHADGTGTNVAASLNTSAQLDSCWLKSKGDCIGMTTGGVIRNCIVEQIGTNDGIRATAASASGIIIDFNTVIANGGAAATGIDPRSTSAIVRNNVVYTINGGSWTNEYVTSPAATSGYNAGQLAVGSQPTNIQTNYVDLSADPFVDSAGGDWTAAASGQLDGAGVAVSGVTLDFAGATRGSPPDIGAFESASSGPTIPILAYHYNRMRNQ